MIADNPSQRGISAIIATNCCSSQDLAEIASSRTKAIRAISMELVQLCEAGSFRDGGTLFATFLDPAGIERSLILVVAADATGIHYKELYPCGPEFDDEHDLVFPTEPIHKGSIEESEWLDAIAAWIHANISNEKLVTFRAAAVGEDNEWEQFFLNMTRDDWYRLYLIMLFDRIPKRE